MTGRAQPYIKRLKRLVKNRRHQLVVWLCRTFYSFTGDDLTGRLKEMGVKPGDVLLAHVSFNNFLGLEGRPTDVIAAIRATVGEEGTILMPSMPFTGTALDYVTNGKMFDVRRTPSAMGIITELFRRSPGTIRSLHPTHPILANGPRSHELVKDHALSATPCGANSPYSKLLDCEGKIVLLGTGIGVLTFFHALEEFFEDQLPESPFAATPIDVTFRDHDGNEMTVTMRLFDQGLSRRRNLSLLEEALKADGHWRSSTLGKLGIILLDAGEVRQTCQDMISNGVYCYDPA